MKDLQWSIVEYGVVVSYIYWSKGALCFSVEKLPAVWREEEGHLKLLQVIQATCWHWEIAYWHRLLEWVGLVFALKDRPVFLMAEHIYLALVKHILYREANWLQSLTPPSSSKLGADWNATTSVPMLTISCVHVVKCSSVQLWSISA